MPRESQKIQFGIGAGGTIAGGAGFFAGGVLWLMTQPTDSSSTNTRDRESMHGVAGPIALISLPILAVGLVSLLTAQQHDEVDLSLAPNQTAKQPGVRLGPGFLTAGSSEPDGVRVLVSPGGVSGAF